MPLTTSEQQNERDLVDVPRLVRRKLQFAFVEQMDGVLPLAFLQNPLDSPYQPRRRKKKPATVESPPADDPNPDADSR